MWAGIEDENPVIPSSEELISFLEIQEIGDIAAQATKAAMGVLQAEGECFIGGDGTPALIQVVGASDAGGSKFDITASVLLTDGPNVKQVAMVRGGAHVLNLIGSYWDWRPAAPLVVSRDESFAIVAIAHIAQATDWSEGAFSAAHWGLLRKWRPDAEIVVRVPRRKAGVGGAPPPQLEEGETKEGLQPRPLL
jgi:hypothetical protein